MSSQDSCFIRYEAAEFEPLRRRQLMRVAFGGVEGLAVTALAREIVAAGDGFAVQTRVGESLVDAYRIAAQSRQIAYA